MAAHCKFELNRSLKVSSAGSFSKLKIVRGALGAVPGSVTDRKRADSKASLEVEVLEDVLEDEAGGWRWMAGWRVWAGRSPAGSMAVVGLAGGSWCGLQRGREEPRSEGGRTTPGHTGSEEGGPHGPAPSPTEPGATVARCQPHLPTTSHRPKKEEEKSPNSILFLRSKSHAVWHNMV